MNSVTLSITKEIFDSMVESANIHAPEEACGYLSGTKNKRLWQASHFFELTNLDHSADHFTLDPKEQFETLKKAREYGESLVAIWHSHPVTPARPSAEDIRLAYDPNIIYVIVSLVDTKPVAKAFSIQNSVVGAVDILIQSDVEEFE